MGRVIENQVIFAAGATASPAVQIPECALAAAAIVHPAFDNDTHTLYVASTEAFSTTEYAVWNTEKATPVACILSDPDATTTDDFTGPLGGLGGWFLRLGTGAATASAAATFWWRFVLDE